MTVTDKVVIIMGATSGMGRATAELLMKRGAKVVISGRREERLKEIAAMAEDSSMVAYKVADVAKTDEVQAVVDLAISKFGRVDVMYNNAGTMPQGNLSERNISSWQTMLDVNIMGVLNGIAAALPVMKSQGRGLIMATDSVAGHVVYPGSAVYNGTKHAVRAIMEGLRQEENTNGIKTAIVSPGSVDTELLDSVGNKDIEANLHELFKQPDSALTSEDIAEIAVFIMDQPDRVDINEVLVRPRNQTV